MNRFWTGYLIRHRNPMTTYKYWRKPGPLRPIEIVGLLLEASLINAKCVFKVSNSWLFLHQFHLIASFYLSILSKCQTNFPPAVTNWKIAPIASVQRQQRRVIMKLQKDTKSVVPFQWLNQVRLKIQWMSSTNDQSNLFWFSNQKYIISSIIILWIHRVQFMSKREPTGMGGSPSHWTAY